MYSLLAELLNLELFRRNIIFFFNEIPSFIVIISGSSRKLDFFFFFEEKRFFFSRRINKKSHWIVRCRHKKKSRRRKTTKRKKKRLYEFQYVLFMFRLLTDHFLRFKAARDIVHNILFDFLPIKKKHIPIFKVFAFFSLSRNSSSVQYLIMLVSLHFFPSYFFFLVIKLMYI